LPSNFAFEISMVFILLLNICPVCMLSWKIVPLFQIH